jgi:guanylate kinase
MPEIAFIMGKSSSGKDSIYKALADDAQLGFRRVVPYTTRPMRTGERNGGEYYFVDEAKVQELESAGKLIELRSYDTIQGTWKYFTVDDGQIDLERGIYLVIGTLEAYEGFCGYFGSEHIMPIYIEVESGERLSRALMRERQQSSPDYRELCRRFLADEEDFSEERLAQCHIAKRYSNDSGLEECIRKIRADIVIGMNA